MAKIILKIGGAYYADLDSLSRILLILVLIMPWGEISLVVKQTNEAL